MNPEPTLEILLATYNGERFLREQLDSIFAQDFQNFRLLARDDGSTDRTRAILEEYAAIYPECFRILPASPGTGSAKLNFLLLMKAATAPYICFSDQDDVWLPNKLSLSMQSMRALEAQWGADRPLLVFTDLRVVDDRLNTLHASFWAHHGLKPARIERLSFLLSQNVVTGCTALVNRPLLDLSLSMPEEAAMHDYWIALLASTLGKTHSLKAQTVQYRQHDQNVLGAQVRRNFLQKISHRLVNGRAYSPIRKLLEQQAAGLLRVHGAQLSPRQRRVLTAYLRCGSSPSRLVRVWTFVRYRFYCTGVLRNLDTARDLWRLRVDGEHLVR